jgi:hypothetical protein
MKTIAILSLAACLILSSCTKEQFYPHIKKIEKELPHKIDITLFYQRYLVYQIATFQGESSGKRWTADVDFNAPKVADDGTYTLFDENEDYSETYGTLVLKIHRNASKPDSLDFIGDGYWTYVSSTGTYSYLKNAKGVLTYREKHYEGDQYDYPDVQYTLTGLSN